MSLQLRRMGDGDLPAAVDVWERSRWAAQPWLEERMGYSHEDNLRHFSAVVAVETEVWVACDDGVLVGLMALGEGVVDQLYVDPRRQREGIGTALLSRARARFPAGLRLYTHQRNVGARAFYEAHGFEVVRLGISPPPESEPDVEYVWEPAS